MRAGAIGTAYVMSANPAAANAPPPQRRHRDAAEVAPHLQTRRLDALVRLDVRAQADAERAHPVRHAGAVALQPVEIDHRARRRELLDVHGSRVPQAGPLAGVPGSGTAGGNDARWAATSARAPRIPRRG